MENIDARALVIDQNNRILLVHDPGGRVELPNGESFIKPPGWAMPGGRGEPEDNDESDTVQREVAEETGLLVEINHRAVSRRQMQGFVKVAFVCYPVSGELKPNIAEISECRWFPQRILDDRDFPMYSLHRAMAQDLLKKLKQ